MMAHTKIEFANTLRGLAALLVVISHYMGVYWTNREAVAKYTLSPGPSAEIFPTPAVIEWLHFHHWINWGALGVGLFFLISGFVIPFSIVNRSRWSFAAGRFFRIWPTYAAGFTLTVIALYVGTSLAGAPWPYTWQEIAVHYFPGARDHFGTPIIDGIIWTLEVEVKFYLLVILLAPFFTKSPLYILAVPLLITVFTRTYLPVAAIIQDNTYLVDWVLRPFAIRGQFLILMFMGVTLHLRYIGAIGPKLSYPALALQYGLFSYLWPSFHTEAGTGAFVSYSAAIPIFLASLIFSSRFKPRQMTTFFADISYPLYVVHAVAGYLLLNGLLAIGCPPFGAIAITFVLAVLAATLIHRKIELPTQQIGRRISRRNRVANGPAPIS